MKKKLEIKDLTEEVDELTEICRKSITSQLERNQEKLNSLEQKCEVLQEKSQEFLKVL